MKPSDLKPSSKAKKLNLWNKALLHFLFCFITGFFTGFAPATTSNLFSNPQLITYTPPNTQFNHHENQNEYSSPTVTNRSLMEQSPTSENNNHVNSVEKFEKQLIIVTTTRAGDKLHEALLLRMAQTLKLVQSPVMWVVVERRSEAAETARWLRRTGVMYRHLTYKENFTDIAAESDHQRNVALSHIEFHRLTGIVHFADVENVYDLEFFWEIRQIDAFGVWPVAMLSANRKRVIVDGPVCRSSKVVGWFLKDLSNDFTDSTALKSAEMTVKPSKINISGFAFNSSILWDPERWGRPTSLPDTSQDSFKFVQDVILEDETKLRGIPADCSKIMLWNLNIPRVISFPFNESNITKDSYGQHLQGQQGIQSHAMSPIGDPK